MSVSGITIKVEWVAILVTLMAGILAAAMWTGRIDSRLDAVEQRLDTVAGIVKSAHMPKGTE